jgi:hypothetical protein
MKSYLWHKEKRLSSLKQTHNSGGCNQPWSLWPYLSLAFYVIALHQQPYRLITWERSNFTICLCLMTSQSWTLVLKVPISKVPITCQGIRVPLRTTPSLTKPNLSLNSSPSLTVKIEVRITPRTASKQQPIQNHRSRDLDLLPSKSQRRKPTWNLSPHTYRVNIIALRD